MDDSRISSENGEDNINEFFLLTNLMKHYLLLGVDTLLMARKLDFESHDDYYTEANKAFKYPATYITRHDQIYNAIAYLTAFQISLFISFLTLPIRVFSFGFSFVMFPFRMLTHSRDLMKKKLERASFLRLIGFGRSRKSALKVGLRLGRAAFRAAHVFFVLLGLLLSGFAIGGFVTRRFVRESMHTTEALNFDYTETSPVAIVPVASSVVLPHKLKLTVSLTLPESEYNRKLGIFQVRVETLSDDGGVILRSSYPTMLRFKSRPVRAFETMFNAVHLITGLKNEAQQLKIGLGWFVNKGHERKTTTFKVTLEQRAESRGGSGVPEIYGGSLEIESELSRLKRVLWDWRRTVFVWVGFGSFLAETMLVLIFFRGFVLPKGRGKSITRHKAI